MATVFDTFVLEHGLNQEWQDCFKSAIFDSSHGTKNCAFSESHEFDPDEASFVDWFVFIQTKQGGDFWFELMEWFLEASPLERQLFFSSTTPNDFKSFHR